MSVYDRLRNQVRTLRATRTDPAEREALKWALCATSATREALATLKEAAATDPALRAALTQNVELLGKVVLADAQTRARPFAQVMNWWLDVLGEPHDSRLRPTPEEGARS